jgi:hypothetical protein
MARTSKLSMLTMPDVELPGPILLPNLFSENHSSFAFGDPAGLQQNAEYDDNNFTQLMEESEQQNPDPVDYDQVLAEFTHSQEEPETNSDNSPEQAQEETQDFRQVMAEFEQRKRKRSRRSLDQDLEADDRASHTAIPPGE